MNYLSKFDFKKISTMIGVVLFTAITGLCAMGFFIQNRLQYPDSNIQNLYTFMLYALTGLGISSLLFTIIAPQFLSKVLVPITNELLESVKEFESASKSLARYSEETSHATKNQFETIKETASNILKIQEAVEKNADNVHKSKSIAMQSKKQADESQNAIYELVQSIEDLNRSQDEIVKEISQQNEDLSGIIKIINEINDKTKIINDIVFQTKLLSFNASVEAARAGEHGKGFSVVAQEIGNLAQMSGGASQEISVLLLGSIQKVQDIVSNTTSRIETLVSHGREKIQKGSEQTKKCEEILSSLTEKVQNVSVITEEISTATQEQANNIGGINSAIQNIEKVTKLSAKATEDSLSKAQVLFNNSQNLRRLAELLSKFFNQKNFEKSPTIISNINKKPCAPTAVQRPNKQKNTAQVINMKKFKPNVSPKTEPKKLPTNVRSAGQTISSVTASLAKKVHVAPEEQANGNNLIVGKHIPHETDPRFEDV